MTHPLRTAREQLAQENRKLAPLLADGEPQPPVPTLAEIVDAVADAVHAEYRRSTP